MASKPLPPNSFPKLFHIRAPLAELSEAKQVVALSAEDTKTCALDCEGKAYCWHLINELDVADTDFVPTPPKRVFKDKELEFFATGSGHRCGTTTTGKLVCTGRSYAGQTGQGESFTLPKVQGLSLRSNNSCAITSGGTYCWGENYENSLGIGKKGQATPTKLPLDLVQIAVDHSHSCGVTRAGKVVCFSARATPDLGCAKDSAACGSKLPARADHPAVAGIPGRAIAASVGGDHSCALTDSGEVYCWGRNGAGESGGPERKDPWRPFRIGGLPKVVSLASGYQHNCALSEEGRTYCWGSNILGQTGPTGKDEYREAIHLAGLPAMRSLSLGATHTCGLTRAGQVLCWGIAIDPSD